MEQVEIIYDKNILQETPRIEVVPEIHIPCWELRFKHRITNKTINPKVLQPVCTCTVIYASLLMSIKGFTLTELWCLN